MHVDVAYDWPEDGPTARALQDDLRARLAERSAERTAGTLDPADVRLVGGVDVSYADDDRLVAAVVVLDLATMDVVETQLVPGRARFPYVPGLLAFRELPTLVPALQAVRHRPDVLVCDGHGVAHPHRFGLACHLALITGVPTFGVAKQGFVGAYAEPGPARGARSEVVDAGETVAMALRTREGVKPVHVSVGHGITLDAACELTLALTPRYRLPETTRAADHLSREALRDLPAPS